MNITRSKKISFWSTLFVAIKLGLSKGRLDRFKHLFALDGSATNREARIAYDYAVFRHNNSRANQYVLTFTLILVLTIIPAWALIFVWVLFQLSEIVCYWMAGRVEIEIRNDCFDIKFWSKFKYVFNIAQFIFTALGFVIFSIFVDQNALLPAATSYLMVVILSSSLNFYSAKFNLFNLLWQLISFVIYSVYFIWATKISMNLPEDFFLLIPIVLTFFASHVGVWTYSQYYNQSLDKEVESHLVQEKLIENSRVLSREKHLMDRIQSTIGEAIIVVDFRQLILQANPAFLKMFDVKDTDFSTLNIADLIDPNLLKIDGVKRSFQPNKTNHFIIQGSPLFIEGEAGLSLFVILDVTDKVNSDQAATQAQKLNALGALSGGIAHDFNNVLAVIKANADLINKSDDLEKIKIEYLSDILVSCENATGLTRQILSFVRNLPLKNSRVQPIQIAENTIQMVSNSIGPNYQLKLQSTSDQFVLCDQNLFKNALINLILNARDAMPDGGEIAIKIFDQDKHVVFSVEDNGEGIREEDLERVTEPFVSMKPNEKGTGIGLSIVKQFAEKSNGFFKINSILGKGTRAQIYLPQDINPSDDKFPTNLIESSNLTHSKKYRILVVDDNVMLAKSLFRQMEIMGHVVAVAHSLDDFQDITADREFDLVVCDIVLKTETGLDIWDYAQQNQIKSKFLYISGNISPELRSDLDEKGPYRLLEKPIDFADLSREIQDTMNVV